MDDTRILLAHGNGGRLMRELIADIFVRHLGNPLLDADADAALLPPLDGDPMLTTDGFTVDPLEFPGGDIGSLAVHGVVNDLAVAGADPRYLTVSALIEEGLEIARLDRIVESLAYAARQSHVAVVAGDTKVVRRGEGSGLYLVVTGVGVRRAQAELAPGRIVPGDVVLVSGPVGDHGVAVMLARQQFGLAGSLRSDSASVLPLARAVRDLAGLKFMRDPTRGGLATVAHEIARASGHSVVFNQDDVPLRPEVVSVCEMLGYDPYFLACEGRIVAVVDFAYASEALASWQALPEGRDARIVGHIEVGGGRVILNTSLGGRRILDELEDDPLPRIC
ncbi:MAG: hydrogenase expression/formation protein HypE [Thiobacillus sp.]|nr:hydrogenase expression/formation protein HypE [Thiobacillus sp.]